MKTLERVSLGLGLLLFVWLLWRIGPGAIGQMLSHIGWGFLAILGLYAATAVLNTFAWRATIPPENRVAARSLLGFLLAGEAINNLTPSAVLGGELVRVSLLSRKIPPVASAASVALAAGAQFAAQALFVVLGLPLVLTRLSAGPVRTGIDLALVTILATLAAAIWLGKRGKLFERLHRVLSHIRFFGARWSSQEPRWRALDAGILDGLRQRPGDISLAVFLFFLGWSTGVIEVYLVLLFLDLRADWITSLRIEVLSVVIGMVLFFVPAKAGTEEGGKYAIFAVLGLNPAAGFALGLVKRMREISWASVGLVLLGRFQRNQSRLGSAKSLPAAQD